MKLELPEDFKLEVTYDEARMIHSALKAMPDEKLTESGRARRDQMADALLDLFRVIHAGDFDPVVWTSDHPLIRDGNTLRRQA